MHRMSDAMGRCVDDCLSCYQECLGSAMHTALKPAANTLSRRIFVCSWRVRRFAGQRPT